MLHLRHEDLYLKAGRWILAFSVFFGWFLNVTTNSTELTIGLLSSFLIGGVILNIIDDELPEQKKSSFVSFALGIVLVASLLQLIL
ncbi:hypothetical protein ACSFXN_16115 [Planococcus sp. 1R117A]|uniref:hypothetical protein n=1 Tax=Planococcus sp. 1R117A TaxID=3447020 RepID=UPI003EDBA108